MSYLESRLIEYEILQEEIGSLSQLKLENERIKQELMQMKAKAFTGAESKSPSASETETAKKEAGTLTPPPVVTPEMGMSPAPHGDVPRLNLPRVKRRAKALTGCSSRSTN